jgi:hypothetical protein
MPTLRAGPGAAPFLVIYIYNFPKRIMMLFYLEGATYWVWN